jgi:hypothetical protein
MERIIMYRLLQRCEKGTGASDARRPRTFQGQGMLREEQRRFGACYLPAVPSRQIFDFAMRWQCMDESYKRREEEAARNYQKGRNLFEAHSRLGPWNSSRFCFASRRRQMA